MEPMELTPQETLASTNFLWKEASMVVEEAPALVVGVVHRHTIR